MQTGPLAGYVPNFSEYVLGPVPLPRPVPPGISVQAIGTFGLEMLATAHHDDPVLTELGIPHGAILYNVTLIEPLGWQGYTVEVLGTTAELTDPPDAPRFTDMLYQEYPLIIIAWRRRVYYHGTTSYLNVLWHPERRDTITLQGLDWDTTQESLLRVHRGLRLLKAIAVRGGRPPDSRWYSKATFHEAYPRARAEAQRRRSPHPRDEDIARELGISLSTMRRYLRQYGRPILP